MGETQRAPQESKSERTRQPALAPEAMGTHELAPLQAGLLASATWEELPPHFTSHGLRHLAMLRMQRQQGNTFVQRMLAGAPALGLPILRQEKSDEEPEPVEPVPDVEGEGEVHEEVAYSGEDIRLHGSVAAEYNGGSFRTEDVTTERGEGCPSCGRGNPCVHVTGTLATDYDVQTTISLPDVPSGLTPCQTTRAQEFIDGVLADHEQAHVDAMEGYNGSTSRPFDFTLCRSRFPASIRAMVAAEEVPRRGAAQGASDLLDPFERVVDLDCEEEEEAEEAED